MGLFKCLPSLDPPFSGSERARSECGQKSRPSLNESTGTSNSCTRVESSPIGAQKRRDIGWVLRTEFYRTDRGTSLFGFDSVKFVELVVLHV